MAGGLKRRAVDMCPYDGKQRRKGDESGYEKEPIIANSEEEKKRRTFHVTSLPPPLAPGSLLLAAEIGRGRFGVVREGKLFPIFAINSHFSHTHFSVSTPPCHVAVKSLPPDQWEASGKEIEAMAAVSGHPCHVAFRGWSTGVNGECHVAMERCFGGELFNYIVTRGRLSERKAAAILRQLADGMGFCHSRGFLHRDLKPENILLVGRDGEGEREGRRASEMEGVHVEDCECDSCYPQVKIADFGLAVAVHDNRGIVTGQGEGEGEYGLAGSPLYMAPEVALNERYGKKADIWSLGVIFHVLLSGTTPFNGKTELEVLHLAQKGEVDFTHSRLRHVSPHALSLLQRMLSRDPMKRPSPSQILSHPWMLAHTPLTKLTSLTTPLAEVDFDFWVGVAREEEKERREEMGRREEEEEMRKFAEELVEELAYEVLPGGVIIGGLSCSDMGISGEVSACLPPPLEPISAVGFASEIVEDSWILGETAMGGWEREMTSSSALALTTHFSEASFSSDHHFPSSLSSTLPPSLDNCSSTSDSVKPVPISSFLMESNHYEVDFDFDLKRKTSALEEIPVQKHYFLCDSLRGEVEGEREEGRGCSVMMSPKTPFDFLEGEKQSLDFHWDDVLLGNNFLYI